MKIAVTYDNGQIFGHFGHTEKFKIYTVEDGKVTSAAVIPTLGKGHSALAGFLMASGVDILICGGIGGCAVTALNEAGIKLCGGVKGSCDAAVQAYLTGTLVSDSSANCDHHSGDHDCSGHNCSERS